MTTSATRVSSWPERPVRDDDRWQAAPLRELTEHLRMTHHAFARSAFERLREPLETAVRRQAVAHPELATVRRLFNELERDMLPHMMREERFIFPYIEKIDAVRLGHAAPHSAFGSVEVPVRMLMIEHQHDDSVLELMRTLTDRYLAPHGAGPDLAELYGALRRLDSDLSEHMRLENAVLFPRAIAAEREISAG